MDIKRITDEIRYDPKLPPAETLMICLNRSCASMLEDACLLTAGGEIREVFWKVESGRDQADEAAVRLDEEGEDLVAFHESRPSSKDGRPNGIRVHHEELAFPRVVFCNSGAERLTVDGEWVESGGYTAVLEKDIHDPEAQKALDGLMRSPEVLKGIEEARRMYAEKKQRTELV